ncbi:hypothetical protein [Consotaella salsifontis]|uniref:Uncharacterized protein n=1 Tax=Consotaella salsifontis TaxID=1365950 RepID=A0A1T4SE25_9HYPH|nr:hypothetical protein [Consotaella salsifontis]SKA26425.1 hypothetical protein SAMN05428963_11077 [Consotaella salsifontis]
MTQDITPRSFDRLAVRDGKSAPRIIWTLAAIGREIGVGPDFVRDTLAKQPGSPVKELGGRYYAFEDALISYMRGTDGTRS